MTNLATPQIISQASQLSPPEVQVSLQRVRQGILTSKRDIIAGLSEVDPTNSLSKKLSALYDLDLIPFVTGSKLTEPIQLYLSIADDLSNLELRLLKHPLPPASFDAPLVLKEQKSSLLASVPNPNLLYSLHDIARCSQDGLAMEQLGQLFSLGRRVTEYRGVAVTWDQAIDKRVWTTNIDTVNIIDALAQDGVLSREDIRVAVEIGVGGGAISKTLVSYLPNLTNMISTDISPYALMCSKRNMSPILREGQDLSLYLGKGLGELAVLADILIVNPPYIPHLMKPDSVDPYRGTGLIKEILNLGRYKLNPENKLAAMYMGMSNLAVRDFEEYRACSPDYTICKVGQERRVPLKILAVNDNREWIDFLIKEHGLLYLPEQAKQSGFPFWHDISTYKITPNW